MTDPGALCLLVAFNIGPTRSVPDQRVQLSDESYLLRGFQAT